MNGDDPGCTCSEREHTVGEVRDVGANVLEDPCRKKLHPGDANGKVSAGVNANV
jgi:hypothetical protein